MALLPDAKTLDMSQPLIFVSRGQRSIMLLDTVSMMDIKKAEEDIGSGVLDVVELKDEGGYYADLGDSEKGSGIYHAGGIDDGTAI